MGSRTDDDYWNTRYAEASCYEHGDENMWWDSLEGEWICVICQGEEEDPDE